MIQKESIFRKALRTAFLLLPVALPRVAVASECESRSFTVEFVSEAMADSVIAANPGLLFERVIAPAANEAIERRHREEGLHLWYKVELERPSAVSGAVKRLAGAKGVVRAQPAVVIPTGGDEEIVPVAMTHADDCRHSSRASGDAAFHNDPLYPRQWHYDHPNRVSINLEKAWEIERGNPAVTVAVLDCWIDHAHPDLQGNMWVNDAELNGLPGVDDDGNGVVDDIYGYNWWNPQSDEPGSHGTHIAGTIAAVNNNGIGGCGIAGGDGITPGVRIMSEGINNGAGNRFVTDWMIGRAFVHAADNGAVIASNSWGGGTRISPIVTTSINYFIEHAGEWEGSPMKGGLVLFAAGNSNHSICEFPFNDRELNRDGLVIVGSVGSSGVRSSFSNYGDWVDIMAPGGDFNGMSILSTVPDGGYGLMNGTSMACPHVAGVAALVVSKFGDGNLTSAQVKQILLSSARDVYVCNAGHPYQNKLGAGIVDAFGALQSNPATAPAPVDGLRMDVTADDEVGLKFIVPADGNGCAVDKCVLYRVGDGAPFLEIATGGLNAGQLYETIFSSGDMISTGNVFMIAVDRWGNRSHPCEAVEITHYTSGIAILNPYATTTFNVFKPADEDFGFNVLSKLDLTFPYHSGSGSVRVTATDPNGIVSARLYASPQFSLTVAPRAETPVGEYPVTIRLENSADPTEFCEMELTCRVEEGMHSVMGPALRPGCSGHYYADDMKGRLEINLRDILYDPFGLDFAIPDRVEVSSVLNECEAWIANDVLFADFEFDEEELFWGRDTIELTIHPYDEYLTPVDIELTIHAPEGAGVDNVNADRIRPAHSGIYTLSGVRLDVAPDCLPPGIYIINGQKTCVR